MGSDKVYRRLSLKERKKEREDRFLFKDRSSSSEVVEEVFDRPTLMTLYELLNKGVLNYLEGVVSAGKESRIYLGRVGGEYLAVKIYLVLNMEFRRKRLDYVAGDPRFEKIPSNLRKFVHLWARREYENLSEAHRAKVSVPRPIEVKNNVLVMQFLGQDGIRYPLLREYVPESDSDLIEIYRLVIENVRKLYKDASLIHGDLSEYNVMVASPSEIYFIDLSQAVPTTHPKADELLMRDVINVNSYFAKRGVEVIDELQLFRELRGKEFEGNLE